VYDTIIIGAGPAGLTAGIYLARGGYKVLILEKEGIGGQIASSPLVENYPGYISVSGAELTGNMFDQVLNLGVDLEIETVIQIKDGKLKKVITEDNEYEARTVIIATGSKYKTLGIPSEEQFLNNGIHFCVSCDGAFYKRKKVAVIGGGNSAITNALYLADISTKVYIVQMLDDLTCEENLKEKILSKKNVEIFYNGEVIQFLGDKDLTGIKIKTKDEEKTIEVDGVFESVGMDAQTEIIKGLVDTDKYNYIISENSETKLPGLFVAGDCRVKEIRQLTTATADGTAAAINAINFLQKSIDK